MTISTEWLAGVLSKRKLKHLNVRTVKYESRGKPASTCQKYRLTLRMLSSGRKPELRAIGLTR